jgi:hypothetical protein
MTEVNIELKGAQPPPRQMSDLDFMLGTISCILNTGTKMTGEIHPVLGGSYYLFNMTVNRENGEQVSGGYVMGWNSVDQVFSSYYYDDAGMQGSATSPGWRDGKLTWQGRYTLGDGYVELRSVFERIGEDHFVVNELIQQDGEWKLLDTQDCHRIP